MRDQSGLAVSCDEESGNKVVLSASQKDSDPNASRAKRRASLGTKMSSPEASPENEQEKVPKARPMPIDDYMRRESKGRRNSLRQSCNSVSEKSFNYEGQHSTTPREPRMRRRGSLGSRQNSVCSEKSLDIDEPYSNVHRGSRARRRGSLGQGRLDMSQHSTSSSTRNEGHRGTSQISTPRGSFSSESLSASKYEYEEGGMERNSNTSNQNRYARRSRSPGRHRQRRRGSLGQSSNLSSHAFSAGDTAPSHRAMETNSPPIIKEPGKWNRRRSSIGHCSAVVSAIYASQ